MTEDRGQMTEIRRQRSAGNRNLALMEDALLLSRDADERRTSNVQRSTSNRVSGSLHFDRSENFDGEAFAETRNFI
jgi:hypothetical protein